MIRRHMGGAGKPPTSSPCWTIWTLTTARFWGHSMGGDVALTLGRHQPERVSALVVTGYSPFAAAGDEAAEMAAWAADLQGGMEGFVAGYERRHGRFPTTPGPAGWPTTARPSPPASPR